ncbi:ATP-binding protein [Gaopeijia maritima]|uniref:histidine kinase n=1 Tax=Gaopeijia maritima TaxID=3119007 RepID=A0ABU9E5N3_9BACT
MPTPSESNPTARTVALIGGAARHRTLVAAVTSSGLRAVTLRAVPEAEVPPAVALVALDGEAERLSGYRGLAALRRLGGGEGLPVILAYPGPIPPTDARPSDPAVSALAGDASIDDALAMLPSAAGSSSSERGLPFEALVARAPVGIAVLSPEGRAVHTNARFVELAGGDRSAVEASPFAGLRTPGTAGLPVDLEGLDGATWSGSVEFEWIERDRELSATVARAPDGAGWLVWVTDTTPARQLEHTLSEAARMEAVERLAGGVAHDFNNILSVITTLSDLLIRLRPEGDPDLEDLEEIFRSARRGSEITRQLSAFSRTTPAEPREIDLEAHLLANEKMLRRFLSEDVALEWALEGKVPEVRVDPTQLDQMILNLALNARDAMPGGGTLTIGATSREVDRPRDVAGLPLKAGRYAVLTVTDTGEGMDEATRSRLFEPFFTTRSWGRKSGLGLSVVHGAVRAMGGAIEVRSRPGEGTRFAILIPAIAPDQVPPADGEVPRGTETILLVEDHVELRRGMRRSLDELGYRVVDAADGAEALALVEEGGLRPHLLVTDVVMPALSGPELSTRIQALGLAVPTLLLSGYTDHPAVEQLRRSGVRVLSKPLETPDLARAVRTALDR